jgi:hypothetical protein
MIGNKEQQKIMDYKMDRPRRRNLPFILISSLIIALAFPAVLALNKGEADFQQRELHLVQSGVIAMMADNSIATIPNPVAAPTDDMGAFPDATTPAEAKGLLDGDKAGYLLYGHDKTPDGEAKPLFFYVNFARTTWTYTVTRDGTVIQGERAQK